MPGLSREPWLIAEGSVEPPLSFGLEGGSERRCVPIPAGSRFSGRLTGVGLGGTDWQRIWPDGTTEIEAHYALRTDEGDLIEVVSSGIRTGPEGAMRALLRGEPVDPTLIYFRTVMRMTADSPRLREFTRHLFIGIGRREPDRVYVDAYALE